VYLVRELASVRLALQDVVTNRDLSGQLEHLAKLIADRSRKNGGRLTAATAFSSWTGRRGQGIRQSTG
jgi:hypothetical protein